MTHEGPAPAGPSSADAEPLPKPLVEIRGVTKRFGELYAVDDVSLAIYPGEFFSLLGASGCGKTTLLRMLGGFEQPDTGTILIDGEPMTGVPPYRRPVNMMFQSYALFPHMTVAQNVAFGLQQERLPRAEIDARVAEMLALVRLTALARRKPDQLSGGQCQRVALARALVKRPKLLLLDEPLGALDRKLREHTRFELVNIQDKLGITFVMVTHDQDEAMTMSCRMAVMEAGRILQVGSPSEVYEYPANRTVAEFIGAVTLFEGMAGEWADGLLRVRCAETEGDIRVVHDHPVEPGTPVSVALRPEKFFLTTEPKPGAVNQLSGIVQDIAYLGDVSIYRVRLAGGKVVEVQVTNLTRVPKRKVDWEQTVWLQWEPAAALVLVP